MCPVHALLLSPLLSEDTGDLARSPGRGNRAEHGPVALREPSVLLSSDLGSTAAPPARMPQTQTLSEQRQSRPVSYLLPIPILDPDVFALLQLFAVLKPFVGWLRVSSRRLTFQGDLLTHMNIWAFQFLQFGRNSYKKRKETL